MASSVPNVVSEDDLSWFKDWEFRQEILIPLDTSSENAKYQPIDVFIEFDDSCWARNEQDHSIRVMYQENGVVTELESQIYDLNFSDDIHLTSCGLIFLIPGSATGNEQYFIYYDSQEKELPTYPNRVHIEDSYYFYEPIPGYPFESHYYKITQNESIIYAIAQSGQFMGSGIAQQVTKLQPQAPDVLPKYGELFASFDFMYYYGTELDDFSGTIEHLTSKEIVIDGNLMVKCKIVSESSKQDVRTTVTYTYYYCPTEKKRICTNVKHEVLEHFTAVTEPEVEGSYASLQSGGVESNSIQDLNFGKIYPYLHIYTEQERIAEYILDPDPDEQSGPGKWANTIIIGAEDDIDLGTKAWVSYDEGASGVAHGLILHSNRVVVSGTEERDGVQVKLREQELTNLPGLESNMAFVQYSRNIIEPEEPRDSDVPNDLIVAYDAEFFSTSTGGYPAVDKEADIFQLLVPHRPSELQRDTQEYEPEETYSVTAYVHLAPSLPFGSALSILTGRNLSYVTAELYQDTTVHSTELASRLSTNPLPSFKDTRFIQKIRLALSIFDWKNLSLFKKVRFHNVEPGQYLIKVYRENPLFGKERHYIGFKTIEIEADTVTRILCKPERKIRISVSDQHNDMIEQVQTDLLHNEHIIATNTTNENGVSTLKAPCSFGEAYTLRVSYNGFIIYEEPVNLRFSRKFVPLKKSIEIQLHGFQVEIVDTWNLPPAYKITIFLISEEMDNPAGIDAEKTLDGTYHFSHLPPAKYHLTLQYKSFHEELEVQIPDQTDITIIFPAEFVIKTRVLDTRGSPVQDIKLWLSREGITHQEPSDTEGFSHIIVPPGTYSVTLYNGEELVGKRKITILGERSFELITTIDPSFPLNITIVVAIGALSAIVYTLKKKELISLLKIGAIALGIISIISPWWMIQSASLDSSIESSTSLFLVPPEMITLTSTETVLIGERTVLPDVFIDVLTYLSIALAIGCVLVLLHMAFHHIKKQRVSSLFLLGGSLSFTGCLVLFYYAMSELAKVGVGSFIGEGSLHLSIPGEGVRALVHAGWSPSIGFYFCALSVGLLIFSSILKYTTSAHKRSPSIRKMFHKNNLIQFFKKFMPVIGIILLLYIIVSVGTDKIVTTFLKIAPLYVILAASLTLPRILIRNIAWQRILKLQKIQLSFIQSLKIFLIGYFYGSITPAYMGQLMRIPYMKDKTKQPTGKLFINCIIETAVHTLSLYGMIVVGAFLVIDYFPEALPLAIILLISLLLFYGLFLKAERGEKIFHFLIKIFIPKRIKSMFTLFVNSFYKDFPDVKKLIIPFLLGIPTWIIIYSQIYILGLSLDIEVPYFIFLMIYPIANLVAFIPITSAGLGTREATLVFLFSFFGMAPEKAVVISLAGHLLTDVLTGIYGLFISFFEAKDKDKDLLEVKTLFNDAS
jgi:uncharacterized protein (TIRG00374 family)